jgi:hypothetical protein
MPAGGAAERTGVIAGRLQKLALYAVALLVNLLLVLAITSFVH